jgi:hypothetical protein
MNLDRDDVVSTGLDESFVEASTFTVEEALIHLVSRLDNYHVAWAKEGVECRVLNSLRGGWIKGKVRISLEFTPDEYPIDLELEKIRRY